MIQKIQTLQKRLITKTEEVVEKDLLIQEKEKLYVELKNILARQPGPEVAEQLTTYQGTLREKTKQMKAMASELNMYQAQVIWRSFDILQFWAAWLVEGWCLQFSFAQCCQALPFPNVKMKHLGNVSLDAGE
jgi:preprotein translocase subunit Sec63